MRIALTGGTGFLGRHLISQLTLQGHQVRAWHREAAPTDPCFRDVTWVRGQLGNPLDAQELVRSADAVIHSALWRCGPSFLDAGSDVLEYWHRNATAGLQLLQAASEANVDRFVFISSGAVHDTVLDDRPLDETHPLLPSTLYGACKASVETLVHHFGIDSRLKTATLRPTSIYGIATPPENSKWFSLVHSICRKETVQANGGSKSVHVDDVAKAAALLLQSPDVVSGQTYNCCDRMISDHEVAELAKRFSGSKSEIIGEPKVSKHVINTERIQSLGMCFGGDGLLEQTVRQLVAAARD